MTHQLNNAEVVEFFRQCDRENQPKEKIKRLVNAYCRQTGQPHPDVWRSLYSMLEARTGGYRCPANVKSKLVAVEVAGHIEDLLAVAKTLMPAAAPQVSTFEYE